MNLRNPLKYPLTWLALVLLVVSLQACLKKLTVKNIVYENSFADGELSGLKVSGWNNGSFGTLPEPRISYYHGQYVLGKLNNNIVRLQFSNDPLVKQSYPNWLGNGTPLGVAGTNARLTGLPGICSTPSSQLGSSAYTIVQTFGHTSNDFTLQLSDAGGNVNDTCTRSWSLGRLTVSVFHN
jgi:hypothetical protein